MRTDEELDASVTIRWEEFRMGRHEGSVVIGRQLINLDCGHLYLYISISLYYWNGLNSLPDCVFYILVAHLCVRKEMNPNQWIFLP